MSKQTRRSSAAPTGTDLRRAGHGHGDWRYILTELAIVTAGLFIAMMLNSLVELAHHRQLVHDARTNIHREIEKNRQSIHRDLIYLRSDLAQVNANIEALQEMRNGRTASHPLRAVIRFTTFDDTAWQTARETGALSYMSYDEVQHLADLYGVIGYVNGRAVELISSQRNLLAPLQMGFGPKQLPESEIDSMLRDSAKAKTQVGTLTNDLRMLDSQLAQEHVSEE